jgi:hypothetical protein
MSITNYMHLVAVKHNNAWYSSYDGSYLCAANSKSEKFFTNLIASGYCRFENYNNQSNKSSNIGYNNRDKKWIGWSHRAFREFEIGTIVKFGDFEFDSSNLKNGVWEAKTISDAKDMAIAFAKDIS